MLNEWGDRNTVFIIGAGASKHVGVPTMDGFINKMYELYRSNDEYQDRLVFDLIRKWKGVFAHGSFDLNNVEALFSAADIERLISIGEKEDASVSEAFEALRTMIVRTVVDTQAYSLADNGRRVTSENAYGELLKEIRKRSDRRFDFITVNYDLGLEFAFDSVGKKYDLGFGAWNAVESHLLKLHGSINWKTEGGNIKEISPHDMRVRSGGYQFAQLLGGKHRLKLETYLELRESLIIPPSFSKYGVEGPLRSVWSNAYRALRNARDIFIIGYSMPETDLMVRYLLSLAFRDVERIRTCWIINPDENCIKRFNDLFGEYMITTVRPIGLKFEQIGSLVDERGKAIPDNRYEDYFA